MVEEDKGCRPLGFLLGLPFAFLALVLSLVGAIIWVFGCLCPCCCCCAGLANLAIGIMKLPIKVISWFTDQIPC